MTKDYYFLNLARHASLRSKDPSTKVGAVIVDPLGRVVSTGYNGFPQRMPDDIAAYHDRDVKYSRIIHAEMNAVLFAHRDLTGCTLYVYPLIPCDRCAVHLVQTGIMRIVAPQLHGDVAVRWAEPAAKTRTYLYECGVQLDEVEIL